MELKSSNKVDVNRWELEIAISPEQFEKEVEKVYNKQKGKISVPGFRKGKAPRAFIEKYYGSGVFYQDALNAIYPYAIDEAAKEAKIELVDDHIDFDIVKMSKEDGLIFKVKVTVMPEISVENYKGIEVKKAESVKVTEEDILSELKKIQDKNARLVTVDEGKAEMGDVVNIDFIGSVDGTKFEGGSAEGISLTLGSKQFIEGFEEQVVGHEIGDEFEIKATFPKNYHVVDLAGKEAIFKTKLNNIQKKDLPNIDDEFIKDISEFDTLDEYKADLTKKILEAKQNNAKNKIENEMVDKFVGLVKGDIPDALIKSKIKELIRDFEYRLQSQGINPKDYMKFTKADENSLDAMFRPQAEAQVKFDLGIKKVAELENIEVTAEDVEKEYEKVAEQYKMKVEQIKKFVPENDIKKDISRFKALEILRANRIEK